MRLILLALLVFCCQVQATVYYVATNGDNSANGTSTNTPFLTIGKAASVVAAGDTVNVGQGVYNEFVTNTASGAAGSPITFSGTRGSNGEWLTVIDPSFALTNWVLAPEGSNGVYKITNGITHAIIEMITGTNFQRVPFVYSAGDISTWIGSVYTNSGISNGVQFLSTPANLSLGFVHGTISNVWDVLGACFASTSGVCYVRFKNGDDPNTKQLRGMWNDDLPTSGNAVNENAVYLGSGINHVIWSNFWVRGAPCGIKMRFTANNNTVVSNYFTGAYDKVQLYNSSTGGPYQNNIVNNIFNGNPFGFSPSGAWEAATFDQTAIEKENTYEFSKYLEGQGGGFDNGVELYYVGNSNVVSGNVITNTWSIGILLTGPNTGPSQHTIICSNYCANHPSVGILWQWGHTDTRVFDNSIWDCNGCIRSMEYAQSFPETNRVVYTYRNTCWNPTSLGEIFYFHQLNTSGETYWPTNWIYQNSFSGGRDTFNTSSAAPNDGFLQNTHIVNNIASDCWAWWYSQTGWNTNANQVADFAYNLIVTNAHVVDSSQIPWFGVSNIQRATNAWPTAGLGMSFALHNGSPAIDSAIDTSQAFTLQSVSYPALPQDSTIKVGSAWDIGALEFTPPVTNTPVMTVNQLNVGQATFY